MDIARTTFVVPVAAFLVAAVLIWWICTRFLLWSVPRGRTASLGVAIVGAFMGHVFAQLAGAPLLWWQFIAPLVGAFLLFFVAALVGTPSHVTIVVDPAQAVKEMQVSPWEFLVHRGGSVCWILKGDGLSSLSVRFEPQFNPFEAKAAVYQGPESRIVALGPVVRCGDGKYWLRYVNAAGQEVEIDPMGEIPRI